MKCLINKNKPHTKPGVGFTYSAHIMYASEIEAAMCIKATNNFVLDDKIL